MTKQDRIDGFLAEYIPLCEKFDVFVMHCRLCGDLILMPLNLLVGGSKALLEVLRAHPDAHMFDHQWVHFNGVKASDGQELPVPQVQNDQVQPQEYNTHRD